MTHQHTQWTYEAHIPHGSGDAEWRVIDAQGNVVAIVDPNMLCDNETTFAEPQARLIASAPELLAALKVAAPYVEAELDYLLSAVKDDPKTGSEAEKARGVFAQILSAIAKAEGTP